MASMEHFLRLLKAQNWHLESQNGYKTICLPAILYLNELRTSAIISLLRFISQFELQIENTRKTMLNNMNFSGVY